MNEIKIGIVDDDALFLSLLAAFISSHRSINVIATANNGNDMFRFLNSAEVLPEILMVDLKMQQMDGIEVTKYLQAHFPDIRLIVVSSHYQNAFLGFMLKTGVSAFIPKGVSPEDLIDIIKTVHAKGFYFMEEQIGTIREQLNGKSPRPVFEQDKLLSDKEVDVLRLIAMQKTAKEIADILFITQRTVEGRKNSMFAKTGAKNIAGLVIYAIQNNVIHIKDLPLITS